MRLNSAVSAECLPTYSGPKLTPSQPGGTFACAPAAGTKKAASRMSGRRRRIASARLDSKQPGDRPSCGVPREGGRPGEAGGAQALALRLVAEQALQRGREGVGRR